MSETPLVHLENIVLRIGEKTVLDGIDLKVFSGDRLVILGQSGGGKSTMLRLILGILKPTVGVVRYRHLEVQRLSRSKLNLLRSRVGMVYQYSALISSMTVRENLALPVEELRRKPKKEIEELIRENLEIVGMTGTDQGRQPCFRQFHEPGRSAANGGGRPAHAVAAGGIRKPHS